METLHLSIITPANGKIFEGDISSVTFPGSEGEFGVLAGHASLVSLLTAGVIELEKADKTKESVAVDWGYVEIGENCACALVDGAVAITGDSESEIAKAIDSAKKLIREASDSDVLLAASEAKIEASAKSRF
jgi:F-type H+-transporting ATPase subunit epsilon